uniref:Pectinesterase catalytic domain-containing protein n=1 Tax=Fagus sylvatica TaxID=28930 RepID=A0A2N9ILC9_FAGSY
MSLEKVTTLVNDQWAYVQQMPDDTVGHDFQSWFDSHDWKLMQADAISANITVASDGSGDFTSIMEAVKAAPNNSLARFVIYIKKATYKEYVSIPQNKWNIMMVGDGMDQTIISGSHSNTTGYGTYGSATFAVDGQQFVAVDITFENTAGPEEGQAVALRSDSDFFNLLSMWDPGVTKIRYIHTIIDNSIENAESVVQWISSLVMQLVVFQKCEILPRQALPGQSNTITAQGASTDKRVNWPGVHILDSSQAQLYTVSQFIKGNSWLPPTGIPYNGGLEG